MTKEEVEKWFEGVKATHDGFSASYEIPCNYCKYKKSVMLLSKEHRSFFNALIYMLDNGFSEWAPFDTTVKHPSGKGLMHIPYEEGISFLREAFCSKECFINYIYDHQAELVELITQ